MIVKFDITQIETTNTHLKHLERTLNDFVVSLTNDINAAVSNISHIIKKLEVSVDKFKTLIREIGYLLNHLNGRLSDLHGANDRLKSRLSQIVKELNTLYEEKNRIENNLIIQQGILASCREPRSYTIYHDDGRTSTGIDDPDAAKRDSAIARISALEGELSQVNSKIYNLEQEKGVIDAKVEANNQSIYLVSTRLRDNSNTVDSLRSLIGENEKYISMFSNGQSTLTSCKYQIQAISSSVLATLHNSLRAIERTYETAYKYVQMFSQISYRASTSLEALERNYKNYDEISDYHDANNYKLNRNMGYIYQWKDDIRKEADKLMQERISDSNFILKSLDELKKENKKAIDTIKDYLNSR